LWPRVTSSGNTATKFRAIAGPTLRTEASKSCFSRPRRRTAHDEDRGRSKTGVSPLNLAIVRHDVHDILQRDGAKMLLKRDREKAAVNSAIRAQLAC
jgi:hypothetical protein